MIDIRAILSECDFSDLSEDNFMEKIINHIPEDWGCAHGASRLVLFPPGEDFVIKIPFLGYIDSCDNEFYVFSGVNTDRERSWDYCYSEILMRKAAKERNEAPEILAKVKFECYVNGYPIYTQKKVSPLSCPERWDDAPIENYLPDGYVTEDIKYFAKRTSNEWVAAIFNYYGSKMFNKIMDVLVNLSDIYEDNVGYLDDRPVVIDYAGYQS